MKFILACLALLHFHQLQVQSSHSAVSDLMERLSRLNTSSTINSTLSELQVPLTYMRENPECCLVKFKEITMEALSSVTVSAGHKCLGKDGNEPVNTCIVEAKKMLTNVTARQVPQRCTVEKCTTKGVKPDTLENGPLSRHLNYLKKLNRRI